MREKLARFMYGRYGMDNLNNCFLILGIAGYVINLFVNIRLLSAVSWIFLLFCIFRMFSRDYASRSRENQSFLRLLDKMPSWFPRFNNRGLGSNPYSSYGYGYEQPRAKKAPRDKTKRIYKCPNCKQKVRVPKGKGKIMITCPKCQTKFQKRT